MNKIAKPSVIYESEAPEFFGSIIDIFEEFLAEKDVEIYNPERIEPDGYPVDDAAIIYGSDYDDIRDKLSELMFAWRVTDKKYY